MVLMKALWITLAVVLSVVGFTLVAVGRFATAPTPDSIRMADVTFPTEDMPGGVDFTVTKAGGTYVLDLHIWMDKTTYNVPISGTVNCAGKPTLTASGQLNIISTPAWYWIGITRTGIGVSACTIFLSSNQGVVIHWDAFVLWGSPAPPGPPSSDTQPPITPPVQGPMQDPIALPKPVTSAGNDLVMFTGIAMVFIAIVVVIIVIVRRGA